MDSSRSLKRSAIPRRPSKGVPCRGSMITSRSQGWSNAGAPASRSSSVRWMPAWRTENRRRAILDCRHHRLVAVDFARWIKLAVPDDKPSAPMAGTVSARPSAKASILGALRRTCLIQWRRPADSRDHPVLPDQDRKASQCRTARFMLTIVGSAAYPAYVSAGAGLQPFPHPALTALSIIFVLMTVVAPFTSGNLSAGEREDRGNRWVLAAFGVIGLLAGWLPAYTDRIAFWTIDGDAVRWVGVVLFAAGGALRLWPVHVLAIGSAGWSRSSPGTRWSPAASTASSVTPAISDCSSTRWDGASPFVRVSGCCSRRSSSRRSWRASTRKSGCFARSSARNTRATARGRGGSFRGSIRARCRGPNHPLRLGTTSPRLVVGFDTSSTIRRYRTATRRTLRRIPSASFRDGAEHRAGVLVIRADPF